MTFPGYLSLGGNEIVNSARVRAYSQVLGITTVSCLHCAHLERALDEGPYTSPDADDAPWWDPTVVESKDFAGLLGTEFVGLDSPVNTREPINLARDGAALNQLRRRAREILVRGVLFARTDCALSYGRTWLAAAVRGGTCGPGCIGDDMCYLACCPRCGPAPFPPEPDPCGDPQWRTLYNVGVLDGPTAGTISKVSGGFLQQVEFTLTAGNPFIHRVPVLVATGPQPGQIIPGFNEEPDPPDCSEDADCVNQALPSCPSPPAPIIPHVPLDPCFPTGPYQSAYRAVIPMPEDLTPLWLETVPYLRIKAGSQHLKRLLLRWYSNPNQLDCFTAMEEPDPDDRAIGPCQACAEINIPVVPAGSTLTLDGRIERAWVDCPGGPGVDTAEPYIYGRRGVAFQWPVFTCSTPMCLEIIADSTSVSPSTSWEIYTVPREDAS